MKVVTPQQVFNVNKTRLFWKCILARPFISKEKKYGLGFKASNDGLTLLLGGTAAGDFKIKPILEYHSENPRA